MATAAISSSVRTVATALLSYLRERGVEQIFGVVGREASAILFDEVPGIDFVLTRHEFTAGVMADVLARISGKPQVCFATLGPGVTNLATAVASACLDRAPVIVLGAQAETNDQFINHTHQCLDNVALMAPMTKYAAEVRHVRDLKPTLDRAFAACLDGLPGPSFISLPIDILAMPIDDDTSCSEMDAPDRPFRLVTSDPDCRDRIDHACELIRSARKPMIVVGTAVARDAIHDDILGLAESLNAPVVSSYTAKGVLPHDHPLNYGAISGYMDGILGYPCLEQIFGPVDLLLLVGYDYVEDLRPTMWAKGSEKRVIRLATVANPTPGILRPDVDVVCSLAHGVGELRSKLAGVRHDTPHSIRGVRTRIAELCADTGAYNDGLRVHQVVEQINEVLNDGIFISDIGFFRHFGVLFSRVSQPYGFITSAGCSTFGFGLPAAMGAQMARPDKRVFMLAGDGGFHSNSQDLETVVRLGLPLIMVVVNNDANGLIRLYQNLGHQRDHGPAVDFGPVDYVALAAANGCAGRRADDVDDLDAALEHAVAVREPYLIEVPIAYDFDQAGGYQALEI